MAITENGVIYYKDITDALSNTVGYGTGKKISDFPTAIPTENDQLLIEQNGEGKSAKINTLIYKARKRNFILIGDSFGGGIDGDNNTRSVEGGGWIERFKTMTSGYCNVYNSQTPLGGVYGFASSRPFLDVLKDVETNISDKSQITDIVVLGGTNDQSNVSGVEAKIAEFATYCHTNYPNARVAIGVIGTKVSIEIKRAYQTCEKYGCEFIKDTYLLFSLRKYVGADGTHLTANGYAFYQQYINEAILTGRCNFYFEEWGSFINGSKVYMAVANNKIIVGFRSPNDVGDPFYFPILNVGESVTTIYYNGDFPILFPLLLSYSKEAPVLQWSGSYPVISFRSYKWHIEDQVLRFDILTPIAPYTYNGSNMAIFMPYQHTFTID